jgi:4-amino-4-deoxy-L-arabinose transferase-like glycosyltransferase
MGSNRTLLYIFFVGIILLFIRLGATTVFQVAEGRNAQCAAEMLKGDGIVPTFNGHLRTDKPPFHYYMMMAAYKAAGITEGASRFFSAVAGLLVLLGTFWFTKRNFSERAAVMSAVILLASLHFIFQFRLATPDPYLILAHCFSLFAFWEGYARKNSNWYYLMYAMMGLAFFTKGPVGLGLPAATIFFFLLARKELNLKTMRSLQLIPGFLIFCFIALPWYYAVHQRTGGDWTRGFFLEHNVSRFNAAVDGHKGPFILPLVFVLAGLFPFSVFIPMASVEAWKKRAVVPFLFFMLLSALFVILPYSISSTKLINYTSPCYPFLAIICGCYLASVRKEGRLKWELSVLAIIFLAFPAGYYFWTHADKLPKLQPYIWTVGILTISGIISWYLYNRKRSEQWWIVLAGGSVLFNLLFFALLFPILDTSGSVKRLSGEVAQAQTVVAYRKMNDAFVFYHSKPIPVVVSANEIRNMMQHQPGAMVIQNGKKADLTDSIPELKLIHDEKDLFSSQHTYIYLKK